MTVNDNEVRMVWQEKGDPYMYIDQFLIIDFVTFGSLDFTVKIGSSSSVYCGSGS